MTFFTDLDTRTQALRALVPESVTSEELPFAVSKLSDDEVYALAESTAAAIRMLEQVAVVAAGVIAARSTRKAGHSGLAQSRGHRTPVALLQRVTGVTRTEASRQARVGAALLEADAVLRSGPSHGDLNIAGGASADGATTDGTSVDGSAAVGEGSATADTQGSTAAYLQPWHSPLREALQRGLIAAAQHDAIRQGLGEPPTNGAHAMLTGAAVRLASAGAPNEGSASAANVDLDTIAAWRLAAEELLSLANEVTVEELGKHARTVRDLLDPEGAEARYMRRYEARSFRMWTDTQGLTHGKFVFDDESAAWIRTIIDTALRPRRGGPRFVSAQEQTAAKQLRDDPRTNDQLAHDLLVDVWKAGAVADETAVFGTRQAGLRLVTVTSENSEQSLQNGGGGSVSVTRSQDHGIPSTSVTSFEDTGSMVPVGVAEQHLCNSGIVPVKVDSCGNPLDVGREQRLYTPKQRIALAVRDGGCRWPACDRPAAYCEAHHIDEWLKDEGRTDIDRGILLCAFHHLQLHNNSWKITREGKGKFYLHPPGDPASPPQNSSGPARVSNSPPTSAIEMRAPLPLTYTWQRMAPPKKHFNPDPQGSATAAA